MNWVPDRFQISISHDQVELHSVWPNSELHECVAMTLEHLTDHLEAAPRFDCEAQAHSAYRIHVLPIRPAERFQRPRQASRHLAQRLGYPMGRSDFAVMPAATVARALS